VTPQAALTAVVARLNAAGLKEARSPLGVRNEGAGRLDRAFSVRPDGMAPAPAAGRGRTDASGIRMALRFRVDISHVLKPNAGQAGPVQALTDLHAVIKALVTPGTTLSTDAFVDIGATSTEYPGGGAYLIQSFPVGIVFELDLTP
jgi:hypothetical protein